MMKTREWEGALDGSGMDAGCEDAHPDTNRQSAAAEKRTNQPLPRDGDVACCRESLMVSRMRESHPSRDKDHDDDDQQQGYQAYRDALRLLDVLHHVICEGIELTIGDALETSDAVEFIDLVLDT